MNTIAHIAQELWVPANAFRQKDLSYHDYLTELTWMLFLKVASVYGKPIPVHLNWDTLIHKRNKEQYEHYQNVIVELQQHPDPFIAGIYAYASTSFKQPEQLAQVISTLATIDDTVLTDDLGEIYEILLEKCAQEENSLHIAPRSLVDLMVILTQPQRGELIQDPLAGTGSFVVATDQYIKVISEELLNKNKNKKQSYVAIEPSLVRQRLALMNCLLHHIDHPHYVPVRWGDSLLSNLHAWPPADVVLSLLIFTDNNTTLELGKQETSLALLQHIYEILKPGGRAAVILPDKVLKAMGPAQQVRTTLLDRCIVHTVLRLPHGIFYPHTIPAHLLFFRKAKRAQEKTQITWFYDLRTDSPIFGQYLHLTREHLSAFEIVYGDDPLGQSPRKDEGKNGRWRSFNRNNLKKQDDRLDICWLQNEEGNNAIITEETWEILDETMTDLKSLSGILRQ